MTQGTLAHTVIRYIIISIRNFDVFMAEMANMTEHSRDSLRRVPIAVFHG
jgi:hypothetical protein